MRVNFRTAQQRRVDREGREESLDLTPGLDYHRPRVSPDGTRIAYHTADSTGNMDIWVFDLARSRPRKLTSDPVFHGIPVWTPDSDRLVFLRSIEELRQLFWMAADGTGEPEHLLTSIDEWVNLRPHGFAPDARITPYDPWPPPQPPGRER